MRILAIDPAIRNTGYAVIEGDHRDAQSLDYGTISLPQRLPQSACLLAIHDYLSALIGKWQPEEMAIERIIYVQSHKTAIIMGSARAAVILAAARHGLKIMEYSPTSVKLAAVGN
ncbi:MAG: crossover junction endodeoxyribonuclease RuvC, partial [Akkermansia sp.]